MTWQPGPSQRELQQAADELDRPRVAELSAELIDYVEQAQEPYPLVSAKAILRTLRSHRHFTLLQQVADAFIRSGLDDPTIRRQYAQALLDHGNLVAAEAVLRTLVADTKGQGNEHDEARGLLGRAYKQMYLATGTAARARRAQFLDRAIRQYDEVYRESDALWHGINAVALLSRAGRDDIELDRTTDPTGEAAAMARAILAAIKARGERADMWDYGTAVEAYVALGHTTKAMQWLDAYLAEADAFAVASTLRQLTEIWDLRTGEDPGAHLLPVLQATLLAKDGGPDVEVGPSDIHPEALRLIAEDERFENVFGKDRFVNLTWFHTALERCRGVARIEDSLDDGIGTGFLADGASLHSSLPALVLVTNEHVVSEDDPEALHPDDAYVTFRALEGESIRHRIKRLLWSSPRSELDTTILELESHPTDPARCPIARNRPRLDTTPPPQTYIIGHPTGVKDVLFSLRDNLLLDHNDRVVHYRTPTLGGSSGSPVFNRSWDVIALHHAGTEHMPRLGGRQGTYPANEGIWLDKVVEALATQLGA